MRSILIVFVLFATFAQAQTGMQEFLLLVEKNSPLLSSLKKKTEAEKLMAKTGLSPDNPEIEFKYMPENSGKGTKQNFGISQRIDFPSVYAKRKKIAKTEAAQIQSSFQFKRREVLHDAQKAYINQVYLKKQQLQLDLRLEQASALLKAWQSRLGNGDATAIELNKVKLEVAMLANLLAQNKIKQSAIEAELQLLAGKTILVAPNLLFDRQITKDSLLRAWRQMDASVRFAGLEVEKSQQMVALAKAKRLPALKLGFENERADGLSFLGPVVGMSIPLWRDRNKVKAAKANVDYRESSLLALQGRLEIGITAQWENLMQSQKAMAEIKSAMLGADNTELLGHALDAGSISILGYFNQLKIIHDVQDRLIEFEASYYLLKADLYKIFL
jgi:outer membrane protein, heavy metal efflux system